MNGDGSLCSGIVDLELFDSSFEKNFQFTNPSQILIIDTNLKEIFFANILDRVSESPSTYPAIWADCVSVAKCKRLIPVMSRIDFVKANLDELSVLSDTAVDFGRDLIQSISTCVDKLWKQNPSKKTSFVITCGSRGETFLVMPVEPVAQQSPSQSLTVPLVSHIVDSPLSRECISMSSHAVGHSHIIYYYRAPTIAHVVDSTGAGDTLFGSIAWAHAIRGLPLELAVIVGICAARMTLMSTEAVSKDVNSKNLRHLVDLLQEHAKRRPQSRL
jgi:sugar/nucleoside kinase (ribokinase family)